MVFYDSDNSGLTPATEETVLSRISLVNNQKESLEFQLGLVERSMARFVSALENIRNETNM